MEPKITIKDLDKRIKEDLGTKVFSKINEAELCILRYLLIKKMFAESNNTKADA